MLLESGLRYGLLSCWPGVAPTDTTVVPPCSVTTKKRIVERYVTRTSMNRKPAAIEPGVVMPFPGVALCAALKAQITEELSMRPWVPEDPTSEVRNVFTWRRAALRTGSFGRWLWLCPTNCPIVVPRLRARKADMRHHSNPCVAALRLVVCPCR